MGIDFRFIPDIDFFNDEGLVKAVYENCGGTWAEIEADYKVLFNEMNQPDGTMNPDDFVKEVRLMIDERGLYLNWIKHNRNQLNAGKMKPERMEKFRKLLELTEKYKRKNQYE